MPDQITPASKAPRPLLPHRILNKLHTWRRLHPRRWWLAVTALLVLLLVTAFTVFANTWTFKKTVTYSSCEVSYGETVAEWDGRSSDLWNENNYHYQTKRFLVRSNSPRQLFPKVAETPPNDVAGSKLDGSDGCQPGFTGAIDTNADQYKWYGARPMAARLGLPALKDVNQYGTIKSDDVKTVPSKTLTPPVFSSSHGRAAAWVDDGAQAVLQSDNREKTQLLWCQGNVIPLDGGGACANIAAPKEGQLPLRGAGYLFTADNCPVGDKCQGADSWYNQTATHKDLDYSGTIGKNERGELLPYFLHLSAVSTYAPTMGTWMTTTYKYPINPELTHQVVANPKTVPPGGSFEVRTTVAKIGPNLSKVEVGSDLKDQPITEVGGYQINEEVLAAINRGESPTITAKFQLTGGEPGKCYDLPVNVAAVATSPNPDPKQAKEEHRVSSVPAQARYCIAAPSAAATYTYEVNSRGAIQSSLEEFAAQAAETYADMRGWSKAGVSLRRVASGGSFTLILASPDQVATFAGCDSTYSCRSGRFVVINDERWRTATPAWNNGGGNLRDYRHMVVNHETGHWLGFGHLSCPSAGAPAPVMQQQSISLQGCAFNPWPTATEIELLKARL